MDLKLTTLACLTVDEHFNSVFTELTLDHSNFHDLWITEQQNALNFRYRNSPPHYQSDWHVAGDPTLIIVCTGTLQLELRDGTTMAFSAGEKFIAQDYLPTDITFNSSRHGHRAKVLGEEAFSAVHIKLSKLKL